MEEIPTAAVVVFIIRVEFWNRLAIAMEEMEIVARVRLMKRVVSAVKVNMLLE